MRGLTTGADEYVGKPYEKRYLLSCAEELIRVARSDRTSDKPPSLLVIDPSEDFREWIKQLVEPNGYRLAEGESGAEGIAADCGNSTGRHRD